MGRSCPAGNEEVLPPLLILPTESGSQSINVKDCCKENGETALPVTFVVDSLSLKISAAVKDFCTEIHHKTSTHSF